MGKNLKQMQAEVREVNEANGWFDSDRSFGDGIALLHSEVSEAFEAYRDWGLVDNTVDSIIGHQGQVRLAKPEGVGSEFADILIRLLDEAERREIDLDFEYERKLAFNKTRGHRHGGKRV